MSHAVELLTVLVDEEVGVGGERRVGRDVAMAEPGPGWELPKARGPIRRTPAPKARPAVVTATWSPAPPTSSARTSRPAMAPAPPPSGPSAPRVRTPRRPGPGRCAGFDSGLVPRRRPVHRADPPRSHRPVHPPGPPRRPLSGPTKPGRARPCPRRFDHRLVNVHCASPFSLVDAVGGSGRSAGSRSGMLRDPAFRLVLHGTWRVEAHQIVTACSGGHRDREPGLGAQARCLWCGGCVPFQVHDAGGRVAPPANVVGTGWVAIVTCEPDQLAPR